MQHYSPQTVMNDPPARPARLPAIDPASDSNPSGDDQGQGGRFVNRVHPTTGQPRQARRRARGGESSDASSGHEGAQISGMEDGTQYQYQAPPQQQRLPSHGAPEAFTHQRRQAPNIVSRQHPYRWRMLMSVSILNILCNFHWMSFASVMDFTKIFYGVDHDLVIYIFSVIYLMAFVLLNSIANDVLKKSGLLIPSVFSGGLIITGTWFKYGSTIISTDQSKFGMVLAGQVMCSMAFPALVLVFPKLVGPVFSKDSRTTVLTTWIQSSLLGWCLAFLVGPTMLENENDMESYMLTLAILTTMFGFAASVTILYLRIHFGPEEEVALPETHVDRFDAAEQATFLQSAGTSGTSFWSQFKIVPPPLNVAFSIAVASFIASITTIGPMGNENATGDGAGVLFGYLAMTGALLGAGVANLAMTFTANDKKLLMGAFVSGTLAWVAICFAWGTESSLKGLSAFCFLFIGASVSVVHLDGLEVATEFAKGFPAETGPRIMLTPAFLTASIFICVFGAIGDTLYTVFFMTFMMGAGSFILYFFNRGEYAISERYAYVLS